MTTLSPGAGAPTSAPRLGWWRARQLQGVLYVLPTLFIVVVFFILPILLVAQMSGSDWELLRGNSGFNFPDNYTAIERNSLLPGAVIFTITYTVLVTALLIGLGLGLALIVQESGRWTGLLRTAFLLPVALGLASASLLAWGLYSPAIGPINPILNVTGIIEEPLSFFGTPFAALMSTSLLIVWKYAGLYMLILLVGLQAIPDEVLEAAAIDGAGRWQTFRRVTLPLLKPALALVAHPGRDRLAAGLRPVLHPDQGRTRQQHRHDRPAHLPRGLPAHGPGHSGSTVDRGADRPPRPEFGPVQRAARRARSMRHDR